MGHGMGGEAEIGWWGRRVRVRVLGVGGGGVSWGGGGGWGAYQPAMEEGPKFVFFSLNDPAYCIGKFFNTGC